VPMNEAKNQLEINLFGTARLPRSREDSARGDISYRGHYAGMLL
jgi:hypothetical protein